LIFGLSALSGDGAGPSAGPSTARTNMEIQGFRCSPGLTGYWEFELYVLK
jgi:hypothetical protein